MTYTPRTCRGVDDARVVGWSQLAARRDARGDRVVASLDDPARVEREHADGAETRVRRHAHIEALAGSGRELVGRAVVAEVH